MTVSKLNCSLGIEVYLHFPMWFVCSLFPFLSRISMQRRSEWPNNYLILSCAVCSCTSVEKLKINYTHHVFLVLF